PSRNACIWSTRSTTRRRSCAFSASSCSRNLRSSSPVISEFRGGRPSLLKACPFERPLACQARSRASCRLSTLFINHPLTPPPPPPTPPPNHSPPPPPPNHWLDGTQVLRNASRSPACERKEAPRWRGCVREGLSKVRTTLRHQTSVRTKGSNTLRSQTNVRQ